MDRTGERQKKVVYDFICDDLYTPMKFKEMAMLLQVPKTRRQELKEVLEELEAEGKIAVSRRGKYYKGEAEKKTGVYRATRKGFGFVTVPEEETDIYIAQENQGGAFDGDEVEVQITGRPSGRTSGCINDTLFASGTWMAGVFCGCIFISPNPLISRIRGFCTAGRADRFISGIPAGSGVLTFNSAGTSGSFSSLCSAGIRTSGKTAGGTSTSGRPAADFRKSDGRFSGSAAIFGGFGAVTEIWADRFSIRICRGALNAPAGFPVIPRVLHRIL